MKRDALKFLGALALMLCCSGRVPGSTNEASIPLYSSVNPNARFASATNALAMMMQVVDNLRERIQQKDLESLHSEDMVFRESRTAILNLADHCPERERFTADVKELGQRVAQLHDAGDRGSQGEAEREMTLVGRVFNRIKGYFPAATVQTARAMASQYRCPIHSEVTGTKTELCPKCGARLDLKVRLLPDFCGSSLPSRQSVRASIRTDKLLSPGEPVTGYLRLTRADGTAVYRSELMVSHTARIHLLMIDPSLTDYHHVHPTQPTEVPGEFAFSFTPRKPGGYLAWADVRLLPMGAQEYAPATIAAATDGEPLTDTAQKLTAIVDDFRYELAFREPTLRAGAQAHGRIRVARSDGTPFDQLEPLMEAFVHLVGFGEDGRTVLHLHPKGGPVKDPAARGGPELEFQFYAMSPGFVRLFAQVQIGGVSKFVPFGVRVEP